VSGITGGKGGDRHVDVEVMHANAGDAMEYYLEVALNGMVLNLLLI
jgi:hypothetical protein